MNIDPEAIKLHLPMMKAQFLDPYGITIRALSKEAGIPRGRLAKLFDGRGTPTMDEIFGLQIAFDHFFDTLVNKKKPQVKTSSSTTTEPGAAVELEHAALEQSEG